MPKIGRWGAGEERRDQELAVYACYEKIWRKDQKKQLNNITTVVASRE